jgi:hypothetical protein
MINRSGRNYTIRRNTMKRILTLLAAALLTMGLSGVAFSEEVKKTETAEKEVKSEQKEVKKGKKTVKKELKKDAAKEGEKKDVEVKKEETKPAKKKKEASGC